MPAPDLRSGFSLERTEPQGVLPLVPEYEGNARRTKSAAPVVQEQGSSEGGLGLPSPHEAALVVRLADTRRLQDLTSSTRRLFARPSAVLLSAEGLVSP
jgi:hypothetical protein